MFQYKLCKIDLDERVSGVEKMGGDKLMSWIQIRRQIRRETEISFKKLVAKRKKKLCARH